MPFYRMLFLGGCILLLHTGPSNGQNASSSGAAKLSAEDRSFLLDAASSGQHEVQMGMLGVERGTSTEVKVYAQRILDDHILSNAEVEALARLKGVQLPDPAKTDPSAVNLSRMTGLEFDQAFVREAVQGHLKDLAEFQKEDQSAVADPDVKGFAHSALPKIQMHLDQAKTLKP
jgi:putative membrane protein